MIREKLLSEESVENPFVDPAKLPDVAKWAAAGFVTLGSILTFFGIQGGVLDRILRQGVVTSLWIFLLVGGGVLCAILAPAFSTRWRVLLSVPAVAVLLLGLVTWLRLPRIEGDGSIDLPAVAGWAIFVGLALLAAWLLSRWRLPVIAAVLMVGIAALSMGLYGATKVSVISKGFVPSPQITATLSEEQGMSQITVKVLAQGQDVPMQLSVYGIGRPDEEGETEILLGEASIRPDGAGNIDSSTTFPINLAAWQSVSVRTCNVPECEEPEEALTLTAGQGLFSATQISGTFTRGEGVAHAALHGNALPPECVLTISVYRKTESKPEILVSRAISTPDDDGRISWAHNGVPLAAQDELVLRYTMTGPADTGCADSAETQLASMRP